MGFLEYCKRPLQLLVKFMQGHAGLYMLLAFFMCRSHLEIQSNNCLLRSCACNDEAAVDATCLGNT